MCADEPKKYIASNMVRALQTSSLSIRIFYLIPIDPTEHRHYCRGGERRGMGYDGFSLLDDEKKSKSHKFTTHIFFPPFIGKTKHRVLRKKPMMSNVS